MAGKKCRFRQKFQGHLRIKLGEMEINFSQGITEIADSLSELAQFLRIQRSNFKH